MGVSLLRQGLPSGSIPKRKQRLRHRTEILFLPDNAMLPAMTSVGFLFPATAVFFAHRSGIWIDILTHTIHAHSPINLIFCHHNTTAGRFLCNLQSSVLPKACGKPTIPFRPCSFYSDSITPTFLLWSSIPKQRLLYSFPETERHGLPV